MWVRTTAHPERVVLTVENTGQKLTPQLVATLSEPFQRGSKRVRTGHAGVGLGLAIVKSIAHAHDGTLTLTPRPAGGLCVTVQLPVTPPPLADDLPGAVPSGAERQLKPIQGKQLSGTLNEGARRGEGRSGQPPDA